jgi:indolepyruvate ferredoxin oxidoreductase, alpha subunit
VVQGARFVLVILDNASTAMTGNQPTPAHGTPSGAAVDIAAIVKGCGVRFVRSADPLDLPGFAALLKEAVSFSREEGVAVVIAKSPCLVDRSAPRQRREQPKVTGRCTGCRICTDRFECPALVLDEAGGKVSVDPMICSGCGVCLDVCPSRAIVREERS